jgi:hypothetical protein
VARLGIAAFLAAALVAFDPILLRQSVLVMTETLAAFLAVCGILALAWSRAKPSSWRAASAGAILGLAVLCRPTFAPWIVLVVIAMILSHSVPHRFGHAAFLIVGAAAVVAPWAARNAVQFGTPIFTTTHGGYTLWLANNDAYYDHLKRREGVFDAERLLAPRLAEIHAETGEDELAYDRRLSREAIETIRRRPGDFALATLDRLHTLWRLTPRQTTGSESTRRMAARAAVGVWYAAVFTLAVAGLWRGRRELAKTPWIWGLLLCLAFTAVHSLYWTDMRMRAPLMPVIVLAVARGAGLRTTTPIRKSRQFEKIE